ncbi:MAG: histidine kinase [Gammaproteobacteria bacterium]|nr:histidine kinase [Gammaproteobacteria bacterium]
MTSTASKRVTELPLGDQPLASRAAWVGLPHYMHLPSFQFWALQGIGWGGWAASWIASGVYWGMQPAYNLAVLMGMVTGMLLTAVLREVYQTVWNQPVWLRVLSCLMGSYLIAALWQVSKNVALFEFYGPLLDMERIRTQGWTGYFRGTLSSFYIILCWSGLYFGIKYYRMLLIERDRALGAIANAREAQLRMLRYQLNPHFLFNTLNAISTLILEQDSRRADLMVNRLSSFLRYSLDNDPSQLVPLEQEVGALRMYLDIEQARFEERLEVRFEIEDEARSALLPGLLLQPLVENAVKYAVARSEAGGRIIIRGRIRSGWVELEVEDDGPGLEPGFTIGSGSRGVGLANIRDRLLQVHGERQELRLESVPSGGLKVVVRMPATGLEPGAEGGR